MEKNKFIDKIFISLLFFLVLACPADSVKKNTENEASEPGQVIKGKIYKVGFRELTFVDSKRGRTLKTAIWYPTSSGDENSTRVQVNGEPDASGGPYPLILFSHGHKARNIDCSLLMQAWASHGFVIAAPNHEKNTFMDYDEKYQAMMQFARPIDLRFVTDQMFLLNEDGGSFLHGLIDPDAIGVSGCSFGGHTTLISAGATPNLDHLAAYCQTHTGNDWDICSRQDEIQALYPGKRIIDESDPRIKAALALAADGYDWFLADGMAKIKVPIMIMGGEKDEYRLLETNWKPMYAGITSEKYLVILKDANHIVFCDRPNFSGTPAALYPEQLEKIKVITSAFWLIHLKKERQYSAVLSEYVASQPDVKMESKASN